MSCSRIQPGLCLNVCCMQSFKKRKRDDRMLWRQRLHAKQAGRLQGDVDVDVARHVGRARTANVQPLQHDVSTATASDGPAHRVEKRKHPADMLPAQAFVGKHAQSASQYVALTSRQHDKADAKARRKGQHALVRRLCQRCNALLRALQCSCSTHVSSLLVPAADAMRACAVPLTSVRYAGW